MAASQLTSIATHQDLHIHLIQLLGECMGNETTINFDFKGTPEDFLDALRSIADELFRETGNILIGYREISNEFPIGETLYLEDVIECWFLPIQGERRKGEFSLRNIYTDIDGFPRYSPEPVLVLTLKEDDLDFLWPTWEWIYQEMVSRNLLKPAMTGNVNFPGKGQPTEVTSSDTLVDTSMIDEEIVEGGPRAGTLQRIADLRDFRKEEMREYGRPPRRKFACDHIHIDPRTVRKHAPRLWENWEKMDFME